MGAFQTRRFGKNGRNWGPFRQGNGINHAQFVVPYLFSCYTFPMTIEQTVETNGPGEIASPSAEIEGIRQLLQKEMAEKGTSAVTVATGDGWESHIREHYAQP